MSFDAQVKAFSKARIIIGPLGAALWGVPFAPSGGSFVEVSTTNYASSEYASLANLMKRDIAQIMVEPNKEGYKDDVVFSPDYSSGLIILRRL
jgi:capsular polysaccharide biosynthesis protein